MYEHFASQIDGARISVIKAEPEFEIVQVPLPISEQPRQQIWIDVFLNVLSGHTPYTFVDFLVYGAVNGQTANPIFSSTLDLLNLRFFLNSLGIHEMSTSTIEIDIINQVARLRLDIPPETQFCFLQENRDKGPRYRYEECMKHNPVQLQTEAQKEPTGMYVIHNQRQFHIIKAVATKPVTPVGFDPIEAIRFYGSVGQWIFTYNQKYQWNELHDRISNLPSRFAEHLDHLMLAHASTRIEGKNYIASNNSYYNFYLKDMYFIILEYHAHGT